MKAFAPEEFVDQINHLNSAYREGNAAPAILEYLHCIRENDVEYGYESELMRAVCPAIKNIRSDEKKEAPYVTMQMLMADERWAGREEGLQEGRVEGMLTAISSLMNAMNWPAEQAMDVLNVPKDERAQYAALLQNGQEMML